MTHVSGYCTTCMLMYNLHAKASNKIDRGPPMPGLVICLDTTEGHCTLLSRSCLSERIAYHLLPLRRRW